MRRRNIKSVAHWVIMSVVLLFPILMVGISSFAQKQQEINVTESYEYETNEVNSADDLVVGNIYKYHYQSVNGVNNYIYGTYFYNYKYTDADIDIKLGIDNGYIRFYQNSNDRLVLGYYSYEEVWQYNILVDNIPNNDYSFYFVYYGGISNVNLPFVSESDYLGEKTIDYTITDQTMRDDVNEWCASFRNLPVNQWYGNLLSAIGLGITTSMMMNVIYTYPLYVLWVYILDLVVDIFLVIINFGHNALKRLGGDNE